MKKTYWFSPKQGELLDALGQPHNLVCVNGQWVRYTVSTDGEEQPGIWSDFVSVASGGELPTKLGENAQCAVVQ